MPAFTVTAHRVTEYSIFVADAEDFADAEIKAADILRTTDLQQVHEWTETAKIDKEN